MRKSFASLFLLAGLMVGCRHNPTQTTLVYSWTSDGNPHVPICGNVLINCITNYQMTDITTNTSVTLPITQTSYIAPNFSDSYELRVNGYDGQGQSISSPYDSANMTAQFVKLAPKRIK